MGMFRQLALKGRLLVICLLLLSLGTVLCACSGGTQSPAEKAGLADGQYTATFTTDSSMFHVNESKNDQGILTVKDGQMTIHVTLQSKRITNLFYGKKKDAQKDGAELIQPTEDQVTYDDGYKQTVYGFDIPVPAIDQEFDVALIGTHGNWYDHKVKVTDPKPLQE